MKHPYRLITVVFTGALLPLVAQAHPGHEINAGFVAGVLHPFTGWDHLTVLLCLGLLAAGRGARLVLGAGALLTAALAGGAGLGLAFPEAAFVEPAILASVLVSVSLLLLRVRIGRAGLLALCLGFTLVHGMAHGQEAAPGNLAAYFAGFTFAGAMIYAAGVWAREKCMRLASVRDTKAATRSAT
jgi:urease accessory protein